jgi:predicted CXXCH cytochrome family protein
MTPPTMGRLAAWLVMLGGAAPLAAQTPPPNYPNGTSVVGTLHNLSYAGASNKYGANSLRDYGEVCVYCHTPHGGGTQNAPLWNRSFSAATYQMYDNRYSSTIDMTVDPSPTGVSMACLSCHDGTIGLDVITNPPNGYTGGPAIGTTLPGGGFTLLGTDLRNDHPVSITYDNTADTKFNPAASVTAAGLVLYSGKVQCGTCHNPHTAQNRPFLRLSNSGSSLCLTCHIK